MRAVNPSALSCLLLLPLTLLSACSGTKNRAGTGDEALDGSVDSGDPDAFASLCFPAPFRCDGERAIPCEASAAETGIDCAARGQLCSPTLGCVECRPGETSCSEGKATWCRNDGTLARFDCDSTQGLTCDPAGCRGPCALNEVQDSYIGCDYYPTVTLNPVWSGFSFAIAVSNTASQPTDVTITRGDQVVMKDTVAANALRTFELPWVRDLKGGDVACEIPPAPEGTKLVMDGAYRVRSNRPVTVYQFSPLQYKLDVDSTNSIGCPIIDPSIGGCAPAGTVPQGGRCLSYSNDASLLLPANALTGSYTALAWPTQSLNGKVSGSGFVTITATEDGTTVQLRGAGRIQPGAGLPESGEGSVTMNRGDVLEVLAANDSDVTGTRIRADKPVQVIAGQSCAYVPEVQTQFCDHIEEALFPEDTLGSTYVLTVPMVVLPPDLMEPAPFVIRVGAILDETDVTFDPPIHAAETLKAGEFLEVRVAQKDAQNILVKSKKPLQIATYMEGQTAVPAAGLAGDPSMSLAVPVEQFRESYLFTASKTYDLNIAAVIAKEGAQVRIDGELIEQSRYVRVGDSEYWVAQVLLWDESVHKLDADQEVGLTVYGYGAFTSYMYPGGADLDRITVPAVL